MIGILGGSFDPIHIGHVRAGIEAQETLGLDEVRFLPSRMPPHRGRPVAGQVQRAKMIALALEGCSGMVLDTREYDREGPSYSLDTLCSVRAETDAGICLIIGQDAFAHFTAWYQWREILRQAHIVVMTRPGYCQDTVCDELKTNIAMHPQQLYESMAGKLFFCRVAGLDISSSQIRQRLQARQTCRYLVPDAVLDFIEKEKIYD